LASAGDADERIVVTDSLNPRFLLPVANHESRRITSTGSV
jgi:hypothetical protein